MAKKGGSDIVLPAEVSRPGNGLDDLFPPWDDSFFDRLLPDEAILDKLLGDDFEIFHPIDDDLNGGSLDALLPASLDDSSLDLLPDNSDIEAALGPLDSSFVDGLPREDPILDDALGPMDDAGRRSDLAGVRSPASKKT